MAAAVVECGVLRFKGPKKLLEGDESREALAAFSRIGPALRLLAD